MKRTPQYGLAYNEQGDEYSASADLDRSVVIDNQLTGLSSAVTDGVMSGWTLSPGTGLTVNVNPGSGFISKIFHKTFSKRVASLQDNSTNYVYMQSRMLNQVGGLTLESEGPRSSIATAVLTDSIPPDDPTTFLATPIEFDAINLSWDANSESDLDHYNLYRSTVVSGPFVIVASPELNGALPSHPFQDIGLSASTHYYYRVTAVDHSGNESGYAASDAITLPDDRIPPEVGALSAYPGNGAISVVYAVSTYPATLLSDYYITVSKMAADGTVISSYSFSNGTSLFSQITGLDNGSRYRITVKTRTVAGVPSSGTSVDATPSLSIAPLDVTNVVVTPGIKFITLSWTPSSTVTGTSIGNKNKYLIRVINGPATSFPIDVGLSTSRKITSYAAATTIGAGLVATLSDNVEYVFRISCLDSFGNESPGVYVCGTTIDSTVPNDPRSISATGMDASISITWKHSSSADVAGYNISIDTGLGFGSDVQIGYIQSYVATGLTNGTLTRVRVRARSNTGILSPGTAAIASAVPQTDIIPPDIPSGLLTTSKDTEVFVSWNPSPAPDFSYFTLKRVAVKETPNVPPSQTLTPVTGIGPSSGELIRNVAGSTSLLDGDLVDGQTYAYYVRATDTSNNASDYSPVSLVQPSVGLSQISKPTLSATGGASIELNWSAVPEEHTAYNIYRSTNSAYGFEYVDSVAFDVTTFIDGDLPGQAYYYQVSAVLDNADVVVDTGSIQPPNSILLGTVTTAAGSVVMTNNVQRIIDGIQAVIFDETTSLILQHKHAVAAINGITVQGTGLLAAIDAASLSALDLTQYQLSSDALAYYNGLLKDPLGNAIPYDQGLTFFISPSSIAGDVPFIGDFQVLVGGILPVSPFSIDSDRNCIVSSAIINQISPVTLSGGGLSYYIPAALENGVSVYVNGVQDVSASTVDVGVQTVRFHDALDPTATVSVLIEPLIPDYSGTFGARQVSLSPRIVLNDFSTVDGFSYRSESGAFDGSDTFFVLVNGSETLLPHAVDISSKAIVFDTALPAGTSVSLEISNREEVQGLLPTNMFGSVDASQVSKGKLIKPQLPKLSHQGRIGETASPLFETTTSSDRYEYSGTKNAVGTGTTPYAFFADSFGQLTIGTSNGVLRTNGFDSFVSGSDPTTATIDTTVNVNGITVGRVSTDDIVKASTDSIPFSGRYSGSLLVMKLSGGNLVLSGEVVSPSLTPLDDGRILVSGGEYYDDNRSYYFESNVCYIYDPTTKAFSNTGSMNVTRVSHAAIRLPNGNVMVSGGAHSIDLAFGETFEVVAATFAKLSSCEIFDIASQTWEQVSDMGTTRSGHGFTVMSDAEILVTGGQTSDTSFDDRFSEVSDPAIVSNTCEIYAIDSNSFAPTGSMERPRFNHTAKLVAAGSVVVESAGLGSELYTRSSETWDLVGGATEQTQTILQQGLAIDAIDGIVKKFFMDSSGILYALTRNSIFFAPDEMTFGSMKGLESIGVVHAVGEASGTLFAATDLGVYEITPDIKSQYTWFQGGLIGSGTTETFDLLAIDGIMFAGTEIGLFKTADSGDTWTSLSASFEGRALGDIYNIEVVGSRMFVQSDDALFYSDDQSSWTLIGRFAFLERESSILSRDSDLFVTSSQGLWVSSDGATFSLVDFDRNRDAAANNVSMIGLFGSDVIVGYDNEMYAVGLDMSAIRLAQFVGTVPTVMVNGTEVRSGFRYDDQRSIVVFEFKRLFSDVVSVATDYQDYYLDPWYGDGPDAPVTIFVNGSEEDFSSYSVDSRLGKVSFSASLDKSDAVSVSIANVTLTGAGEFFHDELEDRMSLSGSGLTLSMENDHSCNILQMGLSIEHNFLERGLERNQYYCLSGSNVDRGMTSFLTDAEFYILGRRDFDRFNSTIDYVLQSESDDPGQKALVPLSILEYSASQLWVGTEGGIFVLDPTNSFSVSPLFPNNQVNGMMPFNNEVWVVTDADIFSTSNGIDFVKNDGGGLPESTFCVSNVAGIPLVGTNDGIYYSDDMSSESFDPISNELVPAYFSIWFKASFSDTSGQEIAVTSPCRVLLVAQGTAYAAIDNVIYFSIDGKSWTKAYVFPAGYGVSSMSYFSYKLYVGTTNGLWTDNNTIRSTTASMTLESVQGDPSDASFSVNDLYSSSDTLVAVGDRSFLYSLNNGTWTSKSVPDVGAIHKVFITSGERLVAVSNDTVFSE